MPTIGRRSGGWLRAGDTWATRGEFTRQEELALANRDRVVHQFSGWNIFPSGAFLPTSAGESSRSVRSFLNFLRIEIRVRLEPNSDAD
jgi:hypothetical protein